MGEAPRYPGGRSDVGRMKLALYALITGGALGASLYVWHTWSDNAYLSPYLLGVLLLVAGVIAATVAAVRCWGIVRGLATALVAAGIALALVGPLGITAPLAEAAIGGGNGSQSPCVAEFRRQNAEQIARHEEEMKKRDAELGIRPPSAEEIRASEVMSLRSGMTQSLAPFLVGMLTLVPVLRRAVRREVLWTVGVAAAVVGYVYIRGPAAWCGQVFGLDSLAVIVVGLAVALRPPRELRARP